MSKNSYGLAIVYELLTAGKPLTVAELCERTGCERKTVYSNIDMIETAGFCTEIIKFPDRRENYYTASLRC